jgi:hypothetical protein
MDRSSRRRLAAAWLLALVAMTSAVGGPVAMAAGNPGPPEPCVPGTVWEDLLSGLKYICIYDEGYGGPRWELLSSGQTGKRAWLAESSSLGCTLGRVGLTISGGSGADAMVGSYRWPCAAADRLSQPAGELRTRVVIQRYSAGWSTCRDSGYAYNTGAAWQWLVGIDMGATPDCGTGTYRAWGYAGVYQGGAWRGSTLTSSGLVLR